MDKQSPLNIIIKTYNNINNKEGGREAIGDIVGVWFVK